MGKFDGKCVVICYAGGGIGKAAAELFANEGATVIVHDDSQEKLDIVGVGEKFVGDLRNKEDADKLISFALEKGGGKIDVLVNNEDYFPGTKKLIDLTTEQFFETCDRNLKTIWHTLAALYPHMKAQGGNISIINVGNIAGAGGHSKLIDYSATKAGLYGLTKTVAKEWARFGTARCNAVNYGLVKFSDEYPSQGPGKKGVKDFGGALNPFQKAKFEPTDIANIILFLASDESKAINASIINATGGMYTIGGD
ncbi:MAG: SDR family NAD(P)-dependent oxidoreductase [Candidatus Helarchaeota archaeon]